MALSLELVEQYFTTWLDFLRLKPYGFFAAQNRDATKSLPPLRFVAGSVTMLCAIWAVTLTFYAKLSPASQKAYPELVASLDAKSYIPQQAFLIVMIFAYSVVMTRFLMWWPLRWSGTIVEVLRSQAYMLSFSVIAAAFQGVVTPLVIFIGERTNLPLAMLAGSGLLLLVVIPWSTYYSLSSLSACTGLRKRRFVEASCLVFAISSMIGALIGYPVGYVYGFVKAAGWAGLRSSLFWLPLLLPPLVLACFVWLCLRWGTNLARRSIADRFIITQRMNAALSGGVPPPPPAAAIHAVNTPS